MDLFIQILSIQMELKLEEIEWIVEDDFPEEFLNFTPKKYQQFFHFLQANTLDSRELNRNVIFQTNLHRQIPLFPTNFYMPIPPLRIFI